MIHCNTQRGAVLTQFSMFLFIKILLERCRNKDDYSADRVDESLVVSLMPPYHVGKDDGAFKVTMLSAIRIINRF